MAVDNAGRGAWKRQHDVVHWTAIARRQHGVISRAQLRAAGVNDNHLTTLTTRTRLVRVLPGVFRVAGAPATYDSSLWVAVLASRGVIGAGSGCHLWQMISDPPPLITVLVPQARRVEKPPATRVCRRSTPISVVERFGLPVTDRATSVLDYLVELPEVAASTFFDRALQQSWLTPAAVERRLARRFPGNARLRRLARSVGDGAHSTLERAFHRLLRRAGITGWAPNLPLCVGSRLIAQIDVAFVDQMLAIELDGRAHHVSPERFQRDRTRQNRLISLGWRVLRFTWEDVIYRPDQVVAMVRHELSVGA